MPKEAPFNEIPEEVPKISGAEEEFRKLGLVDEVSDSDEELRKFLIKLASLGTTEAENQIREIRNSYFTNFRKHTDPSRLQLQLAKLEREGTI